MIKIQDWRKFFALTFYCSRVMLHFRDQVFPTTTEVDLRLFTEGPTVHNKLTHYRVLI